MTVATATTITLDIVSDVVCPWCYIGYRRLEQAMSQLDGHIGFEIRWRPFELNPQMGPEGEDVMDHLTRKYGQTREAMTAAGKRIAAIAVDLGINLSGRYQGRIYNTFDAHQALHWAREQGVETAFQLGLFNAYFERNLNPSAPAVLAEVAESLGLDGAEVCTAVDSGRYAEAVRTEQQRYLALGIHSVPAFIANRKVLVSGAQEPPVLVSAFLKLAA